MSKINSLLSSRFKTATEKLSKMTELAELSSDGQLSSFSGIFRVTPLSESEQEKLRALLEEYKLESQETASDFKVLINITSEVKAINNQAAILHGERIKRAQEILKKYRDGAFSAWLVAAYGNRQTPYNFLQYYELYQQMPRTLLVQLDSMPRQAVYTLASRSATIEEKQKIVQDYQGETKAELLEKIRSAFPLNESDGRNTNIAEQTIAELKKTLRLIRLRRFSPTDLQKNTLLSLLREIERHVL